MNCFQVELGCGNLSLYVLVVKLSRETSSHKDSIEQLKMSVFSASQQLCPNGFCVDGNSTLSPGERTELVWWFFKIGPVSPN